MFVYNNDLMQEIEPGIARLTIQLPVRPGHVHCYVVEGDEGRLLVDTGLALPGLEEFFRAELGEPIDAIVITHFHPDHVWGGEIAAAVTGAPLFQGRLDYEQCELVWGDPGWPERIADWFRRNGVPAEMVDTMLERDREALPLIHFARDPRLLDDGDSVDAWEVVALPGHADGHVGFLREGVLLTGDHLLPDITPAVGVYPESSPDPLGAYLSSLERTVRLAPRLALPSHGEPMHDPAGRAREILEHHHERLAATSDALGSDPRTGYEISLDLFPGNLGPSPRRFAVAETLAHLDRLVATGDGARQGDVTPVTYTAA
ncbi:MAG: MBL fold metallo-hydrolase [Actinobacteria bacterium]|nr:MBL fold metallo-hydrolase [Actinomycetota bacterium]